MRAELQIAKIKFESIDRLLLLCNYSEQGTWLKIACSKCVAKSLIARLKDLILKFEHIEKITINNAVVFDVPLPQIPLRRDMQIVAISKPNLELFRRKFPVITIKI